MFGERLLLELRSDLARGCAHAADAAAGRFALRIDVGEYRDELQFDRTLAEHVGSAGGPPDPGGVAARIEITASAVFLDHGASAGAKRFRRQVIQRAVAGEDPRPEAERRLVAELAQALATWTCKSLVRRTR